MVFVAALVLLVLFAALLLALRERHELRAAAIALLQAPFWCATWRDILLRGRNRPLVLERRGELWLHCERGSERARIAGSSLCWGRCLLLVLEDSHCRLWLGPGNTAESELAALRRELRRPVDDPDNSQGGSPTTRLTGSIRAPPGGLG